MQSNILTHSIRFVLLLIVQVMVLKQVSFDTQVLKYVEVLVYPLFLMLLPVRISHPLLIFIGFILGIVIDIFYGTPGVHASACVFTGFIRPFLLSTLRPREGYATHDSPTPHHLGRRWFLLYSGILLFAHLFFYFSVVVFTFYYLGEILLRTFSSFIISFLLIQIMVLLFNPR